MTHIKSKGRTLKGNEDYSNLKDTNKIKKTNLIITTRQQQFQRTLETKIINKHFIAMEKLGSFQPIVFSCNTDIKQAKKMTSKNTLL